MVALWLPACITDRIKNAEPYVCIWEPSLNPEYVYIIALVGHHGSCFILLYCYLQVFFFMRKRAKVGPVAKKALPDRSIAETSVGVTEIPSSNKQTIQTTHQASIDKRKPEDREAMAEKRERKVFVTLSYILFGYIICWVPFHIVFDISAFDPSLVPEVVFTITFWMTYLNSTLNPFLYNFSSPDFKIAFKKILTRK